MDFRYLTETKNEFNNFLGGILVPHLYNGLSQLLEYSINMYNQIEERRKRNSRIQNPGILNIFKLCLNDIKTLNNYEIENEYKRIKETSGCAEFFDDLVRASFKSYILFLTWDPKTETSKFSDNNFYNNIQIKDFIHKCYIETCEYFKDYPEIFLKKNSRKEINEIIKSCIENSIKKTVPYHNIIQEYLQIEFDKSKENKNAKDILFIKDMVNKIISENKHNRPNIENLVISGGSSSNYQPENLNSNTITNKSDQINYNEGSSNMINIDDKKILESETSSVDTATKQKDIEEFIENNKEVSNITGGYNQIKEKSEETEETEETEKDDFEEDNRDVVLSDSVIQSETSEEIKEEIKEESISEIKSVKSRKDKNKEEISEILKGGVIKNNNIEQTTMSATSSYMGTNVSNKKKVNLVNSNRNMDDYNKFYNNLVKK
jgi:hypothetical protein